jgi:hypothetical protein
VLTLPLGEDWGERSEGPGVTQGNCLITSLFLSFSLREKGRSFYIAVNNHHDFTNKPSNDKGTALTYKNDPIR